ncbi:hypothetical protein BT93_E2642 [Corymbia citriodora subsp. variegata]|nr:hypothetical protein BT93_E2642 [Corymbia citriodora subsp. variegata]
MELNLNQLPPYLSLFTRDSLFCINLRNLDDVVQREYPLRGNQIKVLGSYRGLLCISKGNDRDVAIWNPFTSRHKLLPPLDTEIRGGLDRSACVHGFGYDPNINDYVLLRLVQTFQEPIESAVSIYSLRANAWRQLEEMPYYLVNTKKMGVFVCDHLHWIMTRERVLNSAQVLVAFDFLTQGFVEMGLPAIDNRLDMDLAVLGGCLCLILYREQMGVDVWIMKEYRTRESWEMLFSIPDYVTTWGPVRPLAYSQNDSEVLVGVGSGNLVWYNLQTRRVNRFDIRGMPSSFEAEICLRTHVPVD